MFARAKINRFLGNTRGNNILIGVLSISILSVVAMLIASGFFNSMKLKNMIQQRASVTQVESAFVNALSKSAWYMPTNTAGKVMTAPAFINRILGNPSLDIGGIGEGVAFDNTKAMFLDSLDNAKQTRLKCADNSVAPKVPTSAASTSTEPAEFVFCLSFNNSKKSVADTFMGSDAAFAMIKVSLKKRDATQKDLFTTQPTWREFVDDAQRDNNFQADILYFIFWGKKDDTLNVFEKSGSALKDLR